MSEHDTTEVEGTELDDRDVRALTEYLSVLDGIGRARDADDLYLVVSESGSEYLVDTRGDGACECPDHRHRGVRCKHQRRVAFATGERPIPAWVDTDAVDEQLGAHVDATPQVVATDGGIVEGGDGAEILDDGGPDWVGPFTEYDRYGEPTGARFVRCPECGIEVLDDHRATASHRPACRFD